MSMELVKTEPSHPDKDDQEPKIPDTLPVLPLPETVVFPYMIAPLFVNRERSIKAVDQSLAENRMILLVTQKNPAVDDPKPADLHDFGTVSVIMRMFKLPDGRVRILVQGFSRAKVEYFDETQPYLVAKVRPRAEVEMAAESCSHHHQHQRPWTAGRSRRIKSGPESRQSAGNPRTGGSDGKAPPGSQPHYEGTRGSRGAERHHLAGARRDRQEPEGILSAATDEGDTAG